MTTRYGPLDVLGVIGERRDFDALISKARRRKLGEFFWASRRTWRCFRPCAKPSSHDGLARAGEKTIVEVGRRRDARPDRKVYRVVPDDAAEARRLLRVIDESGEDYLYPRAYFVSVDVPVAAARAISAATR